MSPLKRWVAVFIGSLILLGLAVLTKSLGLGTLSVVGIALSYAVVTDIINEAPVSQYDTPIYLSVHHPGGNERLADEDARVLIGQRLDAMKSNVSVLDRRGAAGEVVIVMRDSSDLEGILTIVEKELDLIVGRVSLSSGDESLVSSQ